MTTGAGGPSLARFDDQADACNAQRKPLIETENALGEAMVAGAVLGALAGAGVGAAASKGDGGAILAGALIGGLVGGTVGYHQGLSNRHSTRDAMLAEIDRDAGVDAGRFSSARGLIGSLNACRNRQLDGIEADRAAGRISVDQARQRLNQARTAIDQDNELIAQVLGHMNRRTDTYLDAARRTTEKGDEALLEDVATYTPGAILWTPPEGLAVKVETANLRAGPGTEHRVVGSLPKGQAITPRGRSGEWYSIAHGKGPAFIHSSLIGPSTPELTQASAAAAPRPQPKTELQRVVVESRDAEAAGRQNHQQLSNRVDDLYTILGTN
ncbi:SH3 domain-containing protein [Novispirillum sp. DQ9]|uniref:SH3 domain-containing protein n=1 Tax=Novispirillum sp. DQ9 TaxID=3398612 RepID=UPI003C798FDA